jgi:hypothetical protein
VLSVVSAGLLFGWLVLVLPETTSSVPDGEVALEGFNVFAPVRMVTPVVLVSDTAGIVEGVGIPRIETVPDKSIVEAALTSALAVG